MRFNEVTGHKEIKVMLARGADSGRVSHAQLFTGLSGYGTLQLALAYVQYINCTDRHGEDSCGECPACRKIAELVHPDVHFVLPMAASTSSSKKSVSDDMMPQWRELWKQTGGVFDEQMWYRAIGMDNKQGLISRAQADEIMRKLSFKAFEAKYKAVIIWLPERMRDEAANALLKILEEPWENTLFILVSEQPDKLLPTIISRTQQLPVSGIEDDAMTEYLTNKYSLDAAEAASIARLAEGDMIVAGNIAAGEAAGGEADYFDLFARLMRLSYNDKHLELIEWADEVASLGREEQKHFLRYSIRLLRDSYMLHAGMDNITRLYGEEQKFCRNFAPFIGNHNIEQLVREMETAILHVSRNGNARIIFPHFALTVSKLIIKQ
jgi:DNA polymerase-3 subunit delta'